MLPQAFDKWYLPNWSEEYYLVLKIENTKPPVYKLCDMQDKPLTGTFYGHELQKILVDCQILFYEFEASTNSCPKQSFFALWLFCCVHIFFVLLLTYVSCFHLFHCVKNIFHCQILIYEFEESTNLTPKTKFP